MQKTSLPSFADNREIAACLREAAQRLEAQGANPFRVGAYRAAAETVDRLASDIRKRFDEGGLDALDALPHIGKGIAGAIAEMLITGRWSQLERLRGDTGPASLFRQVPGIGPELAARIRDALHVETLEDLELAARDGRLDAVEGVGPRRVASIRAGLGELLSRRRNWNRLAQGRAPLVEPPVSLLLDVDRLYREKAAAGALPTIAPKRMNPAGKAWLPVLHLTKHGWHFTVLFSNTGRAHELGRTGDWVVLYFYNGAHEESQRTVVSETRGALLGKRVVRGRETECRAHYAAEASEAPVGSVQKTTSAH